MSLLSLICLEVENPRIRIWKVLHNTMSSPNVPFLNDFLLREYFYQWGTTAYLPHNTTSSDTSKPPTLPLTWPCKGMPASVLDLVLTLSSKPYSKWLLSFTKDGLISGYQIRKGSPFQSQIFYISSITTNYCTTYSCAVKLPLRTFSQRIFLNLGFVASALVVGNLCPCSILFHLLTFVASVSILTSFL
jgi:hypothetical protein